MISTGCDAYGTFATASITDSSVDVNTLSWVSFTSTGTTETTTQEIDLTPLKTEIGT